MAESIGIAFHSAGSRVKMQALLEETQRQAEELQKQYQLLEDADKRLAADGHNRDEATS